jgi:ABC-2 type transport system ATP-binding protein
VSLQIDAHKIYGLLGPNGAGKTTLIRNITQIFYPDSGTIFFEGKKLGAEHTNQIGYMPEERGLYKKMKVGEHLNYFCQLRGFSKKETKEKIDYYVNRFDISSWLKKEIGDLSKGMQQKIQFIATILHDPKLLILDEPFSGLDPINAEIIKNEIFELQEKGITIIFSTHRMENVEEICEDIFLINKGRIILEGSVHTIKQQFKKNLVRVDITNEVNLNDAFTAQFAVQEKANSHITFRLRPDQKPNDLLKALIQQNAEIHAMTEILPSIHEIFITRVNESAQ